MQILTMNLVVGQFTSTRRGYSAALDLTRLAERCKRAPMRLEHVVGLSTQVVIAQAK